MVEDFSKLSDDCLMAFNDWLNDYLDEHREEFYSRISARFIEKTSPLTNGPIEDFLKRLHSAISLLTLEYTARGTLKLISTDSKVFAEIYYGTTWFRVPSDAIEDALTRTFTSDTRI